MKNHPFCSQKLFKSKNVIHYSILPDIFYYQGLIEMLIYVTLLQKESLFQWALQRGMQPLLLSLLHFGKLGPSKVPLDIFIIPA